MKLHQSFEGRIKALCSISADRAFAEALDDFLGENGDKPIVVRLIRKLIPDERLIQAIVVLGERGINLAYFLPWEFVIVACLKIVCAQYRVQYIEPLAGGASAKAPTGIELTESVDPSPKGLKKEEALQELIDESSKDFPQSSSPATGSRQEHPYVKHHVRHQDGFIFSLEELEDDPEPVGEHRHVPRVSALARKILDFRPLLVLWGQVYERGDVDQLVRCTVIPKAVAGDRITFLDLILVAIWQQASFPEDIDDVDDSLFRENHLSDEGDIEELRSRMADAITYIAQVDFERFEAITAEYTDSVAFQ